ncbi:MAG: hypothetical protein RBU37_11975 [Myxococcota bacterium]|jgi:tetratricopeptide (TPR) repeat protein|nr:hypothetical protein [Myxococcota bacterium]
MVKKAVRPAPIPGNDVRVILIPTANPNQEVGALLRLLEMQGLTQKERDNRQMTENIWSFASADGANRASLRLYLELGASRLELAGPMADELIQQIGMYLPSLSFEAILGQLSSARTRGEQRLFVLFLVLAYPNATAMMQHVGEQLMEAGPDELREGLIQGLVMLETDDVGAYLEAFEASYHEGPLHETIVKAMEMLEERGSLRLSPETVAKKAAALLPAEPAKALETVEKALQKGNSAPALELVKAQALRLLGRLSDAAALLQHVPDGPLAALFYLERAQVYEQLGDVSTAGGDFERALKLNPKLEAAKAGLGRTAIAKQQGNLPPAERLAKLDKALANKEDAQLRVQRAELLIALARFEEALQDLAAAAKLEAADPRLPTLKGLAELGAQRYGEALRSAVLARKSAPAYLERAAASLLGRVYLAMDEAGRAASAFGESLGTHPEWPELAFGRGIALELLGHTEKADAMYAQALKAADAAQLQGLLAAMVYAPLPAWQARTQVSLAQSTRPEHKAGLSKMDPLFKRCLQCGSLSIERRTTCKECGSRDFILAS